MAQRLAQGIVLNVEPAGFVGMAREQDRSVGGEAAVPSPCGAGAGDANVLRAKPDGRCSVLPSTGPHRARRMRGLVPSVVAEAATMPADRRQLPSHLVLQ